MATSVFSSSYPPQSEGDEPVALPNLVRSAELNRVRRRGATSGSHRGNRQSSTSYPVPSASWLASNGPPPFRIDQAPTQVPVTQVVIPPPQWASANGVPMPPSYPAWTEAVDVTKPDEDSDVHGSGYNLYCGYEELFFGSDESYVPSPFASHPAKRSSQRFRKSNGCGALIHTNGSPRTKSGTWQAKGRATGNVIPLDKMYFEHGGQTKHFACGCRWHGVGCSICGNALGNVYLPCQAATVTPATAQSREQNRSNRVPREPPNPSAHYVYTFFYNTISSSPSFQFPPFCISGAHDAHTTSTPPPLSASTAGATTGTTGAASDVASVASDVAPQGWDGVSSFPTGEESEYTYGYAEQEREPEEPGAEYDPDGVRILGEPGSPDKPFAEAMLWPVR